MRIGIDARFVGPQGTGLGKYTEKLIQNLQGIDSKNEYRIFLMSQNWQYLKITNPNFKKVLADVAWYSIQEQLKMAGIFKTQNLDLLHVPHFNVPIFYKDKFVVTIHDLIHHNFSQESATTKNFVVYKIKRVAYKITIKNAVKNAAAIITPSQFVKKEIIKTFGVEPKKITVTYEAAEEEYKSAKSTRGGNYLLYVGNLYPHKNIDVLLDAMQDLKNLKLVLVCPRSVFFSRLTKSITEKKLTERVTIRDFQNTNELVKIFEKAKAYIVPSLSEGFGIPGLNAMAAKVPTIASDIPVLREVYSDGALYFDPNSSKDLAAKVETLTGDKQLQKKLIDAATRVVAKYSWQKMAKETLSIYENFI